MFFSMISEKVKGFTSLKIPFSLLKSNILFFLTDYLLFLLFLLVHVARVMLHSTLDFPLRFFKLNGVL